MLTKPAITAPIIGATRAEHLADAIAALDVTLSKEEVSTLEAPYVPHPVHPMVPPFSAPPKTLTLASR